MSHLGLIWPNLDAKSDIPIPQGMDLCVWRPTNISVDVTWKCSPMHLLPLFTNKATYYLIHFIQILNKKIFQLIRYSNTPTFIIANIYVFWIFMIICTGCDLTMFTHKGEQIHRGAFSCDIDNVPRTNLCVLYLIHLSFDT